MLTVESCRSWSTDQFTCRRSAPALEWWQRIVVTKTTRWLATKTEHATWMGGVASSRNAWSTGVQTHSALLEATCVSTISGLAPRPPTSVIWVMYWLVKRYVLIGVIGIISPFVNIFIRFSGSDYLLWTGRRVVQQNSVLSIRGLWSPGTSRPWQLRSSKWHHNCGVGGQVWVRWGPLARRAVGALLH